MALTKSWVVRIWLLVLLISFLVVPAAMLVASGPESAPASMALAAYLGVWLSVWSIVIIVLSAGSVSLEAGIVADSILSRACTRTQYILAKLASRALVIGGVYLLGSSAAAYVSWRYGACDVTLGTMASGIAIVGLALLMLVSLGVTMSAIFNNTIVSIIGLLLLWHVAGSLFAFAGVEYMSPASLSGRLPEILRDSRAPQVVSCSATKTSVSIIFSKDVDPISAEHVDNYTVEGPKGARHVPQTAVYDPAAATVRLSGLSPQVSEAVTVTVDGVTDSAGNEVSPAANEATSRPPPAESEDDAEADPSDEASPPSSEESPDSAGDEEGVTPAQESAQARPRRHSRSWAVRGQRDGAGIGISLVANEATRVPTSAASEAELVAGPVDDASPPPSQESPDPNPDEEGVTPTPEPATPDPLDEPPPPSPEEGPDPTPDEEGVTEGTADVVTPAVDPVTPRPIPEAGRDDEEAGPIDEASPRAPEQGPGPNRHGEGVTDGAADVVSPAVSEATSAPTPPVSEDARAPGATAEAPPPPPEEVPAPIPGDRPPRVTQVRATRATVSVTFSQDMDPVEAEALENYTVESPLGATRLPTTGAYDPSEKTVLLSGLSFAPGDPVKVTVKDMSSRGGAVVDPRHNSATFSEVQNWKYLVGFGVPALLFAFAGAVWFSRRDL